MNVKCLFLFEYVRLERGIGVIDLSLMLMEWYRIIHIHVVSKVTLVPSILTLPWLEKKTC